MDYKVTLAMPVYNVEKYVERALLSALNQTFDSIEFLIIDDKGNDHSMDIVRKVVSTHPKGKDVRIIDHVVNQGTGATKNSAIREAKGEYLFFMDSDDYLSENCILSLYEIGVKNRADITIGSFSYCDTEGNIIAKNILDNACFQGNDVFDNFFFAKCFYVQTWNKLYKLSMLKQWKVKCIPSNVNEDVFFTFQLFKPIKIMCQISRITYFYSVNNKNSVTYDMQTKIMKKQRLSQYIGILDKMEEYILSGGYLQDINLTYYFCMKKVCLVRDIVVARNLSYKQKKEYLGLIPSYSVKYVGAINQQPFYGLMWPYLYLNPFVANVIDSTFILIQKICCKLGIILRVINRSVN